MKRVFPHGALRLFLLMLLEESPRHGYELIRLVEDRFLGLYAPSAGTVYPRLASLEEDGLVEHDVVDGKKVYRLTDAGRAELDSRRAELADLQARVVESAHDLASSIRDEVGDSVRGLREELRSAMKDVRRQQRWAARQAREAASEAWRSAGSGWAGRPTRGTPWEEREERREREERDSGDEGEGASGSRLGMRALRSELDAFAEDVVSAARRVHIDRSLMRDVRDLLLGSRDALVDILGGPDRQEDDGARATGQVDRSEEGPDETRA